MSQIYERKVDVCRLERAGKSRYAIIRREVTYRTAQARRDACDCTSRKPGDAAKLSAGGIYDSRVERGERRSLI